MALLKSESESGTGQMLNRNFITVQRSAILALTTLLGLSNARAAERLTLANGYEVVCHHHALVDGHIRIYLNPAEPDYFELASDAIRQVEIIPDLPLEPAESSNAVLIQPGQQSTASSVPTGISATGKLTPDDLKELLTRAGSDHHVNTDLLASLVKAESGGNAHAISHAGARGLMQLMPGTARQLGVQDSFAPEQNVRGGTSYLDSLLTRYHDNIALALAAYNAGPEAVDRYHGIPPYRETRLYVARVIHEFNRRVAARRLQAKQNLASALPGIR